VALIEAHGVRYPSVIGDQRYHRHKGIVVAIGGGVQIVIITMTCDVIS